MMTGRGKACALFAIRLLRSEAAAAERGELYQLDQPDIGAVEGVVAGGRAGGLGLAAQLAIHGEPLLEDGAPVLGEVLDRDDAEARALEEIAVGLAAVEPGDRHPLPHQIGIRGREPLLPD